MWSTPAIEGKCRMKLLFFSFIPAAFQYHFAKSIMHISMLLWIHLGENRTKHYFNRTRKQSNIHRARVVRRWAQRRKVAGGQMAEALQWSALSLFSSPSFSHGGAMLVGIESWAGYIKSFIHHTYYSASVSGQFLIAPYHLSSSMYFQCTLWLFVKDEYLPVGLRFHALYSLTPNSCCFPGEQAYVSEVG